MKLAALGFAAVAFYMCTAFAIGEGTFDRSLSVSGTVDLDVRSDIGGMTMTVGPVTSVQVHAVLRPQYGVADLARAEEHIRALERDPPIERNGDRIRIGYPKDPSLLNGVSMHLDIQAPRESQIQGSTSSGGIRVDGIRGPVNARTKSGHIQLNEISGEIRAVTHSGGIEIHRAGASVFALNDSGGILVEDARQVTSQTGSGRIEIAGIVGEVRATAHSGSIVVHKVDGPVFARNGSGHIEAAGIAGAIDVQTGSGAIRLTQTQPAPVRARADSGAIHVKLASQDDCAILAQSHSGNVSIPERTVQGDVEKHRVDGKIGLGGPLVDLRTDSSNISID
jgi:DUF4097 and DUF4098 domain-containing protein YvlB